MENAEIGKKLKVLRKSRGLTQQDLADRLECRRSTISNYEIGRRQPSIQELSKIASILGVGLDYFGIDKGKDLHELVANARVMFEDDSIPASEKAKAYKEIMKLYLNIEE